MEKKKTKRSPMLIPVSELAAIAKNIFMLKPNETIILNILKDVYSDGADAGYQRYIEDKKIRARKREARVKKTYDSLITHIEDTIYGGTKPKV